MTLLIHNTVTVQGAPLGEELVLQQRVYRYAQNGAISLNPGEVVQTVRPNDAHSNMTCAAAAAGTKNHHGDDGSECHRRRIQGRLYLHQ